MAEPTYKGRTIKLDDVRKNSIVITDLKDDLKNSVFEQQFRMAAKIIREIIEESEKHTAYQSTNCRHCKKADCKACRYRDERGCGDDRIHAFNRSECQTAVPFIGERGTGKTSAMSSVLEYLRCYRGAEQKNAVFSLGEKHEKTRFITFDMIDANTLTSAEDVMEIILSRMLSYLDDLPSDLDFQDLYRQIDSLHKNLGQVYGGKARTRDGYGIAALQQISDSQKVIEDFRHLVRDFNREVGQHKFNNHPCYLVVALDDVDLYQGAAGGMRDRQFALLEHIYNHLRTPGLIVLMSFNEYILRRKCNEHFAKIYFGELRPREREYTRAEREDIEKLTAQFMSKLFPQEQRIYMPNFLLVNTGDRSELYVKPVVKGEDGDKTISPFATEEPLPVKDFMLRLIAHLTGVYFDAAGTKQHFFEPRNLRELGELFQVISGMHEIREKDKSDSERCEQLQEKNRQLLLNYLYEQYSLKHLRPEEYRQFQQLSVLPLERQNTNLVDRLRTQRNHYAVRPDDIGYLALTNRDRWKYSYGELLHNIYYATRIPRNVDTGEMIYSKEYIHCILGTHSVLLKQLVCDIVRDNGDARSKKQRSDLLRMIGSSVAGRWANEMFPAFGVYSVATNMAGSMSMPVRYFVDWKLPDDIAGKLLVLQYTSEKKQRTDVIQYVKELVLIGMLFTSFPSRGLEIRLEPEMSAEGKREVFLRSTSVDQICFNVLNFVINLYDALTTEGRDGYLLYMQKKLTKLGQDFSSLLAGTKWNVILRYAENQEREADKRYRSGPLPYSDEEIETMHQQAVYRRNYRFANLWEEETRQFKRELFNNAWSAVVYEAISELQIEIAKWQERFENRKMVLPVEHFDMMYNIIKRLANGSYYDIPAEAAPDEVYDYYVRLYKNVAHELEKQDRVYGGEHFAEAFRECVFFKEFCAEPDSTWFRETLTDMLSSAWLGDTARRAHTLIEVIKSTPDSELNG